MLDGDTITLTADEGSSSVSLPEDIIITDATALRLKFGCLWQRTTSSLPEEAVDCLLRFWPTSMSPIL